MLADRHKGRGWLDSDDDGDEQQVGGGVLAHLTEEWSEAPPPPPPCSASSSPFLPQLAYTSTYDPSLTLSVLATPSRGIAFQLWPAALLLCRYLDSPPMRALLATGATVIELGAGCGLAGMLAAALGGRVTVTDLPHVTDHLLHNIRCNSHTFTAAAPSASSCPSFLHAASGGSIAVAPLAWGEPVPSSLSPPSLLLLSDCVYWESLFDPLLSTLSALSSASTCILLSQTPRRQHVESRFMRRCRRLWDCQIVWRGKEVEDDRQWTQVWQLTSKRDGQTHRPLTHGTASLGGEREAEELKTERLSATEADR